MSERRHGVKRHDGPTPNGGAYADAIWIDGALVEIVEYADNGTEIMRTYAERRQTEDPDLPPETEIGDQATEDHGGC